MLSALSIRNLHSISPAPLQAAADDRLRTSPLAWGATALLVIVALFFIIRLLEWDLINEETPNQDDPLPR